MKLEFHHINIVSKNVDELNNFYKNRLICQVFLIFINTADAE